MRKQISVLSLAAVLLSGSVCTAQAAAAIGVQIGVAPPAPVIESPPRFRHGYIWVSGYWSWNGQAYQWIPGHYERERHGYRYVAPSWQWSGSGWVLQPGYWVPLGAPPVEVQGVPPAAVMAPQPMPGYISNQPPSSVPANPGAAPSSVPSGSAGANANNAQPVGPAPAPAPAPIPAPPAQP